MCPPMKYNETHPFNSAFVIFRKLRTDLLDLRTALLAEQQQRARETMDLKQEVGTLREQQAREEGERRALTHKVD